MRISSLFLKDTLYQGAPIKLLSFPFLVIFTGAGLFFVNQTKAPEFFGRKISISKGALEGMFANNMNAYLRHSGLYMEGKKHGLNPRPEQVMKFIMTQPRFQKEGCFSEEECQSFLSKNHIEEDEFRRLSAEQLVAKIVLSTLCNIDKGILQALPVSAEQTPVIEGEKIIFSLPQEQQLEQRYIHSPYWKDFVRAQVKEEKQSFISFEKRSGLIISLKSHEEAISKEDKRVLNEEEKLKHLFHMLSKESTLDPSIVTRILQEIYGSRAEKLHVQICAPSLYSFTTAPLFAKEFKFKSYANGHHALAFVTDIKPKSIKKHVRTEENEELYFLHMHQKREMLEANRMASMYNAQTINRESLGESQPATFYLNDASQKYVNVYFTPREQCTVICDYEDRVCFFIVKDVRFIKDSPNAALLALAQMHLRDQATNLINYWIEHDKNQNL